MIQLASALAATAAETQVSVVSADHEFSMAAEGEGLVTLDPGRA
jgi:hypothetical protein